MNSADTALLLTDTAESRLGLSYELLPLLGRSMMQRAIEVLARASVQRIHVVLGAEPTPVRELLGDGARWGCEIEYHHAQPAECLANMARRLGFEPGRGYYLASAACIPDPVATLHDLTFGDLGTGRVWRCCRDQQTRWSGWAELAGEWLLARQVPMTFEAVERQLLDDRELRSIVAPGALSIASTRDFLRTASALLNAADRPVTIGRGCSVDPAAKLVAPLYLGDHVRIGPDCVVGPYAVIGDGALLARGAEVERAAVMPDTYVGEKLALLNAVARGPAMINARLNTVVDVDDPELLSDMQGSWAIGTTPWRERLLAAAAHVVLWPLAALLRALQPDIPCGKPLTVQAMRADGASAPVPLVLASPQVETLIDGSFKLLEHFAHTFHPGLRDVAAGRLRLVGPTPRSREAVSALPHDWQEIYADTRCGLLNECVLLEPGNVVREELFACDSVASANQGEGSTARRLLFGYLKRLAGRLSSRATLTRQRRTYKARNRV